MTKLKKLLLTLAPISAVMIATPIILTSCSTNAEQNNGGGSTGGGTGNGGNPGGGSDGNQGGGGGSTTENPKLEKDKTNDQNFVPTKEGLYKKVEETVKAGKPGQEETNVAEGFKAYSKPTELDVKDSINIWSFNKWNDAVTKQKDVTYVSNLVDVTTSNKEDGGKTKWDISFKYKFQVEAKVGDKTENVLAEKLFKASNIELTSNVSFNTEPTMLMVNGTSKLDEISKPKSLYAADTTEESKVLKEVKAFLTTPTSAFDVLGNFKSFINTKKIVGEQVAPTPIWQAKSSDPMATVKDNTMTVNLTGNWTGKIKKDAKKADIDSQLKDSATAQTTKTFILTYVKDSDGWTPEFDAGNLDTSKKTLTYKMTLKKANEKDVVLDLVFTPVAS